MKRLTVAQLKRARGIPADEGHRLELLRWLWDHQRIPHESPEGADDTEAMSDGPGRTDDD